MTIKKGLLKPTIQITLLSFVGIIFSFLSQLVIAYYFGITTERDAYFAAIVVPTYLGTIFTGSIGFVFLPQIIELRNNNFKESNKLINTVLVSTTLVLLILIFLGIYFSESILRVTALGFDDEKIIYTQKLFRILLLSSLFLVLTNLVSYLYQIKQRFIRPALAPLIIVPISILFVVTLNSEIGIMSLALGSLVGSVISLLIVLPILFTKEFSFNLRINMLDENFISIIKISIPLFLGGILFRSAPVFERMIASGLPPGSISILGYSGQLITTLATVATSGIIISFFPSMSDSWTKDINLFNQYLNKGIRSILILTIPIAFSFILFGDTFVEIIFQRGAFTQKDTLAVSETFSLMTPAFIMLCLGGITSKIYYISKRTLDLTIISSFELLSYFLLSYFLSQYFGYKGIAIGTSIAYSVFMLVYFFYATFFIIRDYNYKLIVFDVLKITSIAIFSFGICYLSFIVIENYINKYSSIAFSLLIAFILYLQLLFKFKNTELISLIKKIKK